MSAVSFAFFTVDFIVYTNLFKFDCETSNFYAYVNHARILSWNQPVLSNESKVSCSRKQPGASKLTTDRYSTITSQTCYPLRHAASVELKCISLTEHVNEGFFQHISKTNTPCFVRIYCGLVTNGEKLLTAELEYINTRKRKFWQI